MDKKGEKHITKVEYCQTAKLPKKNQTKQDIPKRNETNGGGKAQLPAYPTRPQSLFLFLVCIFLGKDATSTIR
jgi:hypothetical protein